MTAVLQLSGEGRLPMVGGGQAAIGRGWQRAIGKAQGDAWFLGPVSAGQSMDASEARDQPPILATALVTPGGAVLRAAAHVLPTVGPSAPGPGFPSNATSAHAALAGASPAVPAASTAPPSAVEIPPNQRLAPMAVLDEAGIDEPAMGGKQSRVLPRQQPVPAGESAVHVHVERQADGLHVWFGASSLAAGALQRVLDLPAWQGALPERIARVVCNGVPLQGRGLVLPPPTSARLGGHNQEP
jgi:hypothetical protein